MDARSKKLNEPILDFDPVTNSQDPQVEKLTIAAEGDAAAAATFFSGDVKHVVRYSFVREDGAWKVDDIAGGAGDDKWDLRDIIKPPKKYRPTYVGGIAVIARSDATKQSREKAPKPFEASYCFDLAPGVAHNDGEAPPPCSAAAAKPPLADGVARLLAFAEELLVGHHRLVGMDRPPVVDIGPIVRHADHQAGGLGDRVADEARAGAQRLAHSAAAAAPPISTAVASAFRAPCDADEAEDDHDEDDRQRQPRRASRRHSR